MREYIYIQNINDMTKINEKINEKKNKNKIKRKNKNYFYYLKLKLSEFDLYIKTVKKVFFF